MISCRRLPNPQHPERALRTPLHRAARGRSGWDLLPRGNPNLGDATAHKERGRSTPLKRGPTRSERVGPSRTSGEGVPCSARCRGSTRNQAPAWCCRSWSGRLFKSTPTERSAGALLVDAQTAKEEQSPRVGVLRTPPPSEIGLERARGRCFTTPSGGSRERNEAPGQRPWRRRSSEIGLGRADGSTARAWLHSGSQ